MRKSILPIACLLVTVSTVAALKTIPALRRSTPGVIRWCLGEPGATQCVNDDADKIISAGWDQELIALSDQLMDEYGSIVSTLPEAPFAGGRLLPLDRLPPEFRKLGGSYGESELVLWLDYASTPTAIVLTRCPFCLSR